MKNQELAKIFYEIANYLKMEDVAFKPQAYERAALSLQALKQDIEDIYKKGGKKDLDKIPGVGQSIAKKIEEYLKTGRIKYYQELKKDLPIDLSEIIAVEGMGPKKAKILYQKLGIKTVKDLEIAVKAGKIAPLFGFGEKTQENIKQGIAFLKKSRGRFLLGEILAGAKEILEALKSKKQVEQISAAGSLRRRKETIGDVDILIASPKSQTAEIMDFFTVLPGVVKVWSKGPTKSSVRMEQGFDIDLRVVPQKSYGSALQYFTGSKEHNIAVRKIAMDKGLKLNEYGVFKGRKMLAGWTEKGVYRALGLRWIEPELRENNGEVEAALSDKLPEIIRYSDIKGDLHCHSDWDGGENSILEMAGAAQKMGYEYLGIADHTKFLRIEHGLNERQLSAQRKEIDKLNTKYKIQNAKFRILQGCEANILKDGSIDIKDQALKKLDYAIAGIHSHFKISKTEMTQRIVRAMKNPYIKIISHPTGRILKKRDEYKIDFARILRAAQELGMILEINSWPTRLDLNDKKIKAAKTAGVKMVINTDSHHKGHLRFMEFGIAQARRGWAEKKDIINARALDQLLKLLK